MSRGSRSSIVKTLIVLTVAATGLALTTGSSELMQLAAAWIFATWLVAD